MLAWKDTNTDTDTKRPYRHFPDGAEILQVVFKRYKATFQGVQVVFSKKDFFRTTLMYSPAGGLP